VFHDIIHETIGWEHIPKWMKRRVTLNLFFNPINERTMLMTTLHNFRLKPKLIVTFLLSGLIPALIVSWLAANKADESFRHEAFNQMISIREIKKNQIENFFAERLGDVRVLADNPFIHQAMRDFDAVFDEEGGASGGQFKGFTNEKYEAPDAYRLIHDKYFQNLKFYMEQYGYYDLFLMCPDHGDTSFTVTKEADFGQRANEIPSALRDVWHIAAKEGKVALSDTKIYPPSNNLPAQFVAAPIRDKGEIIGVVALQISIATVNKIMQQREGMGKTGETYLVGPDRLMRSDSFLDPEGHSIIASFAGNVSSNGVETVASQAALSGKSGAEIVKDYNGSTVLSAYTPVQVGDVTWALLAEIDEAEVDEPVKGIYRSIAITIAFLALGIAVFARLIAGTIAAPLSRSVTFAEKVADGDFRDTLAIEQKDEVGLLAKAINMLVGKTGSILMEINMGVDTLSSASSELSSASKQMSTSATETSGRAKSVATAAEEMSANMDSVAAAIEEATANVSLVASSADELTSAVNEISENTGKASVITAEAVNDVQSASEKVAELGRAADEIGQVTETITEISDQTNLLALNATIEAARAGEAGKGFAVVANEIKDLAKQTAEATSEIKEKISSIQNSTKGTVDQISQISLVINEINTIVSTIAAAVEEQTATTGEIATNMTQASQGLQEVSENVAQSSAVSAEIAKDISGVNQATEEMNDSSRLVINSVEKLSKLSTELHEMSRKFKV
jgi:methyl-accepting chemotaxis protein